MIRHSSVPGPFAAWAGAVVLAAAVAVDAVYGRWVLLPFLVAGFYAGLLVVDLLARPLAGRGLYFVGVGVLWVGTVVALAAAAPLWLGWTLWFPSPFLRTVGAIFLFLSVGAPAWAARSAMWQMLVRSRSPKGDHRYLGNPPRDAAAVILLGTALLTLNWGVLLLAGVYLLRSLLRPYLRASAPGGSPLRPSIVIPTLNEEKNIGPLLSDLELQTREAYEVIVVDGRSIDGTAAVVENFPGVRFLEGFPPVAEQRNLGGREARGDLLIFLDADVRLKETFLEDFLRRFEYRDLGVACSFYMPPHHSPGRIKLIYALCNVFFALLEDLLPSGSGQCFAVRSEIFRANDGFDTSLKVAEDMELIRRLSRLYRFGVIPRSIRVSDRRFKERGILRMAVLLVAMSVIFTIGRFRWANLINYEFGNHDH
ncbi:MAG: glycosyltransferase [Rubrobacteraceae bacterium]